MTSGNPVTLKEEDLPLKGIRVLDLGRVMAGPSGAQLLGDYGADVLRIEDMEGDETRRWPPVANGEGCNYQSVNRNKRGMVLNLKTPAAREVLSTLVKMSDVIMHSYLPDVAKRLGLDDETVRTGMLQLLRGWRADCHVAESIDAALVVASVHPPALVISDYRLREQRTGAQAIAALRKAHGAALPALLITGDTAPERLREAQASGVPLLHKPVDTYELFFKIKQLLN